MKFFIAIIFTAFLLAGFTPVEKTAVEDQEVQVSNADLQFEQVSLEVNYTHCEPCSFDEAFPLQAQVESQRFIQEEILQKNYQEEFSFTLSKEKVNPVNERTCLPDRQAYAYRIKDLFLTQHYRKSILYPIRV